MKKKEKRNSKAAKKYLSKISNRSVKKTLRHTFATMVFTGAMLVGVCYLGLQLLNYLNTRLVDGPLNLSKQVNAIDVQIRDLEVSSYEGLLGIITPAEMASNAMEDIEGINTKLDELEEAINVLNDARTSEVLVNVQGLRDAMGGYATYGEQVCKLLEVANAMQAKAIFAEHNGEMEQAVSENIQAIKAVLEEKQTLYLVRTGGTILVLSIIIIVMAIFCIVTSIFILRNLCGFMDGSIEKMLVALRKVADGDLSAKIELEGDNEFSALADDLARTIENIKLYIEKENDALAQMAEKDMTASIDIEFAGDFAPMKQAVNDITSKYNNFLVSTRDAAIDVTGAADNMSNVSQNLATASTQQAASVQELLAIIEHLNDNVRKVAESAKSMSDSSIRDNQEVVAGNLKMQELVTAMNEIEKASKQIYGIVDMIEEIARKTSMLSLNASIEAARAGEQGKGFAVVAEEIRALAEASTDAVHKISELVGASLESVEQGSNIAQDTATLFENIVKNGESHVELTREISMECQNQADTLHSVVSGVQEIAATVESNSQLAEEASATSQQLSASAQCMSAELETFKLREQAS